MGSLIGVFLFKIENIRTNVCIHLNGEVNSAQLLLSIGKVTLHKSGFYSRIGIVICLRNPGRAIVGNSQELADRFCVVVEVDINYIANFPF